MYWILLAGLGAGVYWLTQTSPPSGGASVGTKTFGALPADGQMIATIGMIAKQNGIAIAEDCSWVVESEAFLPAVGSALYQRPLGTADGVGDSLAAYGSAWGFVLKMLDAGASPAQAAATIVLEAPVDLTAGSQHCGQVTALSPAMAAWRTSLAQRIAQWQEAG